MDEGTASSMPVPALGYLKTVGAIVLTLDELCLTCSAYSGIFALCCRHVLGGQTESMIDNCLTPPCTRICEGLHPLQAGDAAR